MSVAAWWSPKGGHKARPSIACPMSVPAWWSPKGGHKARPYDTRGNVGPLAKGHSPRRLDRNK